MGTIKGNREAGQGWRGVEIIRSLSSLWGDPTKWVYALCAPSLKWGEWWKGREHLLGLPSSSSAPPDPFPVDLKSPFPFAKITEKDGNRCNAYLLAGFKPQ